MGSWSSSVSREIRALESSLVYGCPGSWKMELPTVALHGGEMAAVPLDVVSALEWPDDGRNDFSPGAPKSVDF